MTTPTDTSRAPAVRFGMGYYTATTCPAIVGNLLVYRNIAHMEPAWVALHLTGAGRHDRAGHARRGVMT